MSQRSQSAPVSGRHRKPSRTRVPGVAATGAGLLALSVGGVSLAGTASATAPALSNETSAQAPSTARVAAAVLAPSAATGVIATTAGVAGGSAAGVGVRTGLQGADAAAATSVFAVPVVRLQREADAHRAAVAAANRAARAKAKAVAAAKAKAADKAKKAAAAKARIDLINKTNRAARALKRRALKKSGAAAVRGLASGSPRDIGRSMAAARGWTGQQFACLNSLWTKESNWTVSADNPTSSAYGIPQALPGSRMAKFGADWRTNPRTQIAWGLDYIAGRYGTPCAAWSHSKAVNWY